MHRPTASERVRHYGLAVALSTTAIALRLLLGHTTTLVFVTFYPAVMASAWWGGRSPSILTVALCAAAAAFFWMPPFSTTAITNPTDLINLLLFVAVGSTIGLVTGKLRETQARLRSILEATSDGFALIDTGWCTRYVNPQFAALVRRDPHDLSGHRVWDWLPSADTGPFAAMVRAAMGGTPGQVTAYDQHLGMWLDVSSYPTRDGIAVIARNVTAAKELEQRQTELMQQLEAANRLKDDFLAIVSHELRTPLNAVIGWTQLLQRAGDPTRAIDAIQRNAATLSQLVNDLLDSSRIVSGKLRMTLRPTDLVTVVQDAIEVIRPSAEQKRIRLSPIAPAFPVSVMGDGGRLQQAVVNLLSNAIKFTPESGRIDVTVTEDGTVCTVRVADSGHGIAADILPRIFDRFVQADDRGTVGLGLGLAITKHIVEAHGGTVSATSAGPMQGATFTLALPLALSTGPTTDLVETA